MAKQVYSNIAESLGNPNATTNNSGGDSFTISIWERLERLLVLGSDSNTYYQTSRELTIENANCVLECIKADGLKTVNTIVQISDAGRAAKNDSALFALAICAGHTDSPLAVRKAALAALPKVARIGTHLFQFVNYVSKMRGWGRSLRTAIADWYTSMPADKLALQVVKYAGRNTEEGTASSRWSHDDLLRLSHATGTQLHNVIFDYITHENRLPLEVPAALRILEGTEKIKLAETAAMAAQIVADYKLPHEVVPKQFANSPEVWQALLPNMGLTALIRSLNRLTSYGVLTIFGETTKSVVARITDQTVLRKARIHPVVALNALRAYSAGTNRNITWSPIPQVATALEEAFYASFESITPSGKNIVMALDVSGSMTGGSVAGLESLRPYEVTAAMAMVTARKEPNHYIMGFTHSFIDLGITAKDSLAEAMKKTTRSNFGSTDCSLAIDWATRNKIPVDAFIVYTDNEHNTGSNPNTALRSFRNKFGRNTKGIAVATSATSYSIFDSDNPWALNMAGFDASAPAIISEFIK